MADPVRVDDEPGGFWDALKASTQTDSWAEVIRAYDPPDPALAPSAQLTQAQKLRLDSQQIRAAARGGSDEIGIFELDRQKEGFDNQIVKDYDSMPPEEFQRVYGPQLFEDMVALSVGAGAVRADADVQRSSFEFIQDMSSHIAAGVPRLVGSTGSFAVQLAGLASKAPLFNLPDVDSDQLNQLSTALSQGGADAAEAVLDATRSTRGQILSHVDELRAIADSRRQERQYALDVLSDGKTLADLRNVGSSAINAWERMQENPSAAFAIAAESVPSLFGGGWATKGLLKATESIAGTRGGRIARSLAFPGVVGGMEGADAFSGAVNAVMNTSFEDLEANSPQYRELISQNISQEEARRQIATEAGLRAAPGAAVVGAATASLFRTQAFETAPFRSSSARSLAGSAAQTLSNLSREGAEETIQGAAGTASVNWGKQLADETQRVMEDMGQGAVEGFVAGIGLPAATGTAEALLRAPGAAGRAAFDLAARPYRARAEARAAANAAASPTSIQSLTPRAEAAREAAPVLGQSLRDLAAGTATPATAVTPTAPTVEATTPPAGPAAGPVTPTTEAAAEVPPTTEAVTPTEPTTEEAEEVPPTAEETEAHIQRIESAATLQPTDVQTLTSPTVIGKIGAASGTADQLPTRLQAMTAAAEIVKDTSATVEDRIEAATFVTGIINDTKDLFGEEAQLPPFLANLPADHPVRQQFDEYAKSLNAFADNPEIQEAMGWLNKEDTVVPDQDLSQVDLASPQGQQIIQSTVNIATHAPHKANERVIDQLLQSDAGTPEQRQTWQNTKSMLAADRLFRSTTRPTEEETTEEVEDPLFEDEFPKAEQDANNIRLEAEAAAAKAARAAKKAQAGAAPGAAPAAAATPEAEAEISAGEKRINLVTGQINTDGGDRAHQKSMAQHTAEVNTAVRSGNPQAIRKAIRHVQLFAETLRNKVRAINESAAGKGDPKTGRVPYKAFDGRGMRAADGVFSTYFNRKATNSVKYAQTVHAQALALTQLANDFIAQNPGTGLTPSDDEIVLNLPPDLFAPAPASGAGGGSTAGASAGTTPAATTSQTPPAATPPGPPPTPPATQQSVPVVPTTIPPAGGTPQYTAEQVQDETKFTTERLNNGLAQIRARETAGTITPNNRATRQVLQNELQRRTARSQAGPLSTAPTDAEIKGASTEALRKRADEINVQTSTGKLKAEDVSLLYRINKELFERDNAGDSLSDIPFDADLTNEQLKGASLEALRERASSLDRKVGRGRATPENIALLQKINKEIAARRETEFTKPGAKPAAPAAAPKTEGVPFIITKAQRAELKTRGYTDDDIKNMTPKQAHEILAKPSTEEAKSRITPEQAQQLSAEGLNKRMERLEDLRDTGKATPEDMATYKVLHDDLTRREDEAAKAAAAAAEAEPTGAKPEEANIWYGSGDNSELSNLARRPFKFRDKLFKSVEHAYQSWKSGEFDPRIYDVFNRGKPGTKHVGIRKARTENNWNIRLMERLMKESFEQNPKAMQALLDTGNATLTHNAPNGKKDTWTTEFPRLLTEIREANQKKAEPEKPPAPPAPPAALAPPALDLIDTLEIEETPETNIKTVFPKLVQQAKNWFHKAFKVPKKLKSRLFLLANPLAEVSSLLADRTALQKFMDGAELEGYSLDQKAISGHQTLLNMGYEGLKFLQGRMKQTLMKTNAQGETLLKRIQDGDPESIRTRDNRIFNILEITETGYRYNPQLIQAAMLAALDWAMNMSDRQIPVTVEDIAKILGISDSEAETYLADFENGLDRDIAVRSLTENIRKFWGLDTNRATNEDFTKGIPEAIAKEMLMALQKMGLLQLGSIKHQVPRMVFNKEKQIDEVQMVTAKEIGRVWFDNRSAKIQGLIHSLDSTHNLLRDIALVDASKEGYSIGVPITEVDETQLRQGMVKLTSQNKIAVYNGQHTPYFLDRIQLALFRSMGMAEFVSLMSKHPYTEGDLLKTHTAMGYNKNDWDSIKGRQRGLRATYRAIEKQVAAMELYVKTHNDNNPDKPITIDQVPVYYKHHVNRLGRAQMDGASNPQTDKTGRHVFVSTKARINVSKPGSRQFEHFLKTIGQGIGLKTEREFGKDIAAKVINQIIAAPGPNGQGKYNAAYLALREWLKTDQKDLPRAAYNLLKAANLNEHGLHSLMAMARYINAHEAGEDLTRFEHWNPLEADGKTNGVINALMMASGDISALWLRTIAKGGIFFGRLNKTLNQHYLEDSSDIYQTDADGTTVNMTELNDALAAQKDKRVKAQFEIFQRLMASIYEGVTFDANGQLQIGRAVAKDPQMKSAYAAGPRGIAKAMSRVLAKAIYEKMSEAVRTGKSAGDFLYGPGGAKQFEDDLRALTSNEPVYMEEKNIWFLTRPEKVDNMGHNPSDFTLTEQQLQTLTQNMRMFLVNPMMAAIESTVGQHTKEVTDAVQKGTQIQSIFLRNMFIREVIASMLEKQMDPEKHDWHRGEISLSANDMERIQKLLLKFSPFIDTGTQRYMMSGGETTGLFKSVTFEIGGKPYKVTIPQGYSRSLDGQLETLVYIYGATYAGVRAIPTLNIGSGDGQMMMNALANHPEEMKRMLHVFDGMYMPADKIEEYSELVNGEAFKTWTSNSNPIRAVAESYAAFMAADPIGSLFPGKSRTDYQDEALIEISRVIANKRTLTEEDIVDSNQARAWMEKHIKTLNDLADKLDARRQAYSEFLVSVDHMASGEKAFVNKGIFKLDPNISMEDLALLMQQRVDEILAGIQKRKTEPVPAFAEKYGQLDPLTGVRVSTIDQIKGLYKKNELMTATLNTLAKEGYRIVFGTPSQLDAWESQHNTARYKPGSNQGASGKIDPVSKIITVSNETQETMLHELIHAATIDKVTAFYTDPDSLSQHDYDAISRIQDLMNEWLGQLDLRASDAGRRVDDAIYEHQQKADAAKARGDEHTEALHDGAALNEFMAWVLSNQELATEAAKIKVQNPLAKIVGKALKALKELIWGSTKAAPTAAPNLLAQLRFNTQVLMATPTVLAQVKASAGQNALFQSAAFGNNDRLTVIRTGLSHKITAWLHEPTVHIPASGVMSPSYRATENAKQQGLRQAKYDLSEVRSHEIVYEFARHFPDLNKLQAFETFQMLQAVLMTDIKLNPVVMTRLQELYDHVISNLKRDDFKLNNDPNDQADNQSAQDKFDALHGLKIFKTDEYGRSSFLSSFLSLAVTSDEFRNILSNMEKPKVAENTEGGVDALLENASAWSINRVSAALSGEKSTSRNVIDALDDLTAKLVELEVDQKQYIDMKAEGVVNQVDQAIARTIQELSAKTLAESRKIIASTSSRLIRSAAQVAKAASIVVNQEASDKAANALVQALSTREGYREAKALLNELIGRTKDNANIWDLISKVRAIAQQTRQRYRDQLPDELAKQFSRPLSVEERTAMYRIFGKADIMALLRLQSTDQVLELLSDPRKLADAIRVLEGSIRTSEGARSAKVIAKTKQLAEWMMTARVGEGQLKNANAVARLFGQSEYQQVLANPELVNDVDRLATLYALRNHTSQANQDLLKELINTENAGLKFILNYLNALRKAEMDKVASGGRMASPNYAKGHVPSTQLNQGSFKVFNNKQHAEAVGLGYIRTDDYTGSSADRTLRGGKGYYFSPVSSRTPFRQGILQTVHYTASGIDPQTGYASDELTAGRISNPQVVDIIRRQIPYQKPTEENLMAIYDDQTGETVAYERSIDPAKVTGMNHSTDLLEMMGVWKGRQVEESLAPALNEILIDELKKTYDEGLRTGRKSQFTNVMTTSDPVLADAVSLIPNYTRDYAESVFGKNTLMVRRDLELQTLGDRQASLGDLFTGNTRWSEEVQKRFQQFAMGLFATKPFEKLLGENKAYPTLIRTENLVQDFVANAKNTIVIRSVIVPAANLMSNFGQLVNRGVPVRYILSAAPKKVIEINTYIRLRDKWNQLEAELVAAQGENKLADIRKLESRMRAIEDSYKRLSIWPLIEGGQFASISQGKVTAEDLALGEDRWSSFVEKQLEKIPDDRVRTAAKYVAVTRDTALYQILAASVQYGDFVAKAILFDYLTSTGTNQQEAIAQVSDAFINYNVLAGRGRDALERNGLLWFYNYKLRSIKEAAYLIRNHPLRALLMSTLPMVSTLQSAIDSNAITLAVEGDLDWSIGIGMGVNSIALNPVVNFTGLDSVF